MQFTSLFSILSLFSAFAIATPGGKDKTCYCPPKGSKGSKGSKSNANCIEFGKGGKGKDKDELECFTGKGKDKNCCYKIRN
jgi:hypothetical protein